MVYRYINMMELVELGCTLKNNWDSETETAYVAEVSNAAVLAGHHSTDANGFFSFEVSDPNNFLMISYIGHETIKVTIDRTEYDITLKGLKNMPKVDVAADSKKVLY